MKREILLAIETSSPRGSVALGCGPDVIAQRELTADRRHAGELMPALREMIEGAGCSPLDISVLCFSKGPGSFTGLRVAATIARLWQSSTGCRVMAVPTLEAIARNALSLPRPPPRVAVMLDARQGRVFGAVFELTEDEAARTAGADARHEVSAWLAGLDADCALLGDGVPVYARQIAQVGLKTLPEECWWPHARQVLAIGWRMARAGEFCPPEQIVPMYLRPPECEEVYERRRAEARARRGQ